MFKSYLRTAIRNLLKQKMASAINIIGLTVTIGCVIVCYLFIDVQLSMDNFHDHRDSIHMVEYTINLSEKTETWGNSPLPLGAEIQNDIPGISGMTRVGSASGAMRYQDQVFNENIRFVDKDFFEMFSFPLKEGSRDVFNNRDRLVITESIARKYFAQENPIGKPVIITFENKQSLSFVVGAVAENLPVNSSFSFSILAAFDRQSELGMDMNDWGTLTRATFLKIDNPAAVADVEKRLQTYLQRQNAADINRPMQSFKLDSFRDIPTKAFNVRGSVLAKILPGGAIFFAILTVLILSLACLNYVNIAIVSATRRQKEIGIRKVIGGSKTQLIWQFLGEHLVLCVIAMVLGVFLAEAFLIPGINSLMDVDRPFQLSYFDNVTLWAFFGFVLLITGLGAGAYPAFYISGFQPVTILRGAQTVQGKKRFTRVLLTIQFMVSFVLIIFGIISKQNVEHQRERDWGYDQSQTIIIPVSDAQDLAIFGNIASQFSGVKNVAGSSHHVGRSKTSGIVEILEDRYDVTEFAVGANYPQTMKMRLQAGRYFQEGLQSDIDNAALVNETFLKTTDWSAAEALGQTIKLNGEDRTIVGVIADFHYNAFVFKIQPVVMRPSLPEEHRYLAIEASSGNIIATSDYLKKSWAAQFPNLSYEGFFQDEVFDGYFRGMTASASMFSFLSAATLLVSCMGLFGLVAFTIARRMKEISIRKVLGAGTLQVINLVNREFFTVLLIAIVLGGTIGFFVIDTLFSKLFVYHSPLNFQPFLLTGLMVFFVAALTIISQVYRAALVNPVKNLRDQ